MAQNASSEVFTLKVTLKGVQPPVWRRLLVPATCTLAKLHKAIQSSFGWEDCHLHLFLIRGEEFGSPDAEENDGASSERATLKKLDLRAKEKFRYEYDFGDCWEHDVTVEDRHVAVLPPKEPICIDGKGACPPEDCGGAWGYQDMLATLRDPSDPRYKEIKEWLDTDHWDAAAFDLDEVNDRMNKALARQWPRGLKKGSKD
jgi:hypothetical protein